MKKKNLLILLLIPFIISLLGIVTVNITFDTIENDIEGISWNYSDAEAFKISDRIRLQAQAINSNNYPLAKGNNLVWTVANKDLYVEEPLAKIVEENGYFYLIGLGEGEVIVTCSNEKGNVMRQMTVYIYKNGAIVVNPEIGSSQNNIDDTIYYGEFDLKEKQKVKATFKFNVRVVSAFSDVSYSLTDHSSNIKTTLENNVLTVEVLKEGDASFTLVPSDLSKASSTEYKFKIVDDGVNVYTYEDLLDCTNRSEEGEIVVLRKHFESIDNAYVKNGKNYLVENGKLIPKANNIECFGNYNHKTGKFNFAAEIYDFETTFNQEYIKQWNAFAKNDSFYREISNMVKVGIRVQKDFYGNGYTINLHNLTYPYKTQERKDANGNVIVVPSLTDDNLFRGPLHFYTLGDPNGMPLVTAYGQDNIGMYVDGNQITVNDINMKNCDFGNSLTFLDTVGTVLETSGDAITVKNSRLANGKHIVRSFSSTNVNIDNCLLSNARNFLITVGTNEYVPIDGSEIKEFSNPNGQVKQMSIEKYLSLSENGLGDAAINSFLFGSFNDANLMANTMNSIDSALNNRELTEGIYKGTMKINNTLFYRSGIASISVETLFNGPFLFNGTPSIISTIFSKFTMESKPLVPLIPKSVSGLSYPVKVEISGQTKFYDYKDMNTLDLTGLINENISPIASQFFDGDFTNINIDDIFPLKTILINQAKANGQVYTKDGTNYVNVAVAYYGGGLNLSEVDISNLAHSDQYGDTLNVKLLDHYITLPEGGNEIQMMKNLMIKTVTVVTGQNPFKFRCIKGNGYLFDETPDVSQLRKNLKGE